MNDGTLRATVTSISEANITALARLLAQGNGPYMLKIHKRRIVSIAKIARQQMIEDAGGRIEVIVKDEDSQSP